MKKIELGQAVTILANIGVIASIVFLAVEIRQNNQMMMSQTRSNISHNISSMLRQGAVSEYFEDIVGPSALDGSTTVETLRFRNWSLSNMRMWEDIHFQWTMGLFDDSEYEKEKVIWAGNIALPETRNVFCEYRDAFRDGFVSEMELLMSAPC